MNISRVAAVYFSATGNTSRVVCEIAQILARAAGCEMTEDDFSLPASRKNRRAYTGRDIVVFGMPTYAGRIPNKILPDVQTLFFGSGTQAVPVVTFGNRNFDSALAELRDVLSENGFMPCAGAAIACRHAFTDAVGTGRPDAEDQQEIRMFASMLAARLQTTGTLVSPEAAGTIPGGHGGIRIPAPHDEVGAYYTPLGTDGQPAKFLKAKPVTDPDGCDLCGICADVCPMGSIDPTDVSSVPGICIKCHACVRKCPKGAKRFDDPDFLSHRAMLEQTCQRRADSMFVL